MKYNDNNRPLVCMQTQSRCYVNTEPLSTIRGVLWHSTGADNPMLKRYVQPSDVKPGSDTYTKEKWLEILGTNENKNDWNHDYGRKAGLNCWIGKLADGTITTVQTMPWNFKPWGCGKGSKGSCNNGWIQFEICEDDLNSREYFNATYIEACEITAYICKMYNIDPKGTVRYKGIDVPTILCHADSHKLKLGGNHGDVYHWFNKYGKTMDHVRNDVAALMTGSNFIITQEDFNNSSSSVHSGSNSVNTAPETTFIRTAYIENLCITDVTSNAIVAEFTSMENFSNYSWYYRITPINGGKSVTKSFKITSKSTTLDIAELIPNTAYKLEILIEDSNKNIITSQNFVFQTLTAIPSPITDLEVNAEGLFTDGHCTVSFESPVSWGTTGDGGKGYRVCLLVNGKVVDAKDNLISYCTGRVLEQIHLKALAPTVALKYDDIVQIGIQAWVKDDSGNYMFDRNGFTCSAPICLNRSVGTINNIYMKTGHNYERAVLHNKLFKNY